MFDVPRNITFARSDHVYKMEKKLLYYFTIFLSAQAMPTQDKEISFSITPNHIKSNWGNRVFPWIKILLGTAAFMLLQNLIFTSVRVKWLLLRSICGIDGTLDEVNDFTFAILAMFAIFFIVHNFAPRVCASGTLYILQILQTSHKARTMCSYMYSSLNRYMIPFFAYPLV